MKKYLSIILGIVLIACLVACGDSSKDTVKDNNIDEINNQEVPNTEKQEKTADNKKTENDAKVAVVYFSGTGNTKKVAKLIAKEAKADIIEIIPKDKYTSADLNYNNDNCRANKEMNDDTARPAISNDLGDVSKYDVIYLGYPIWWGTVPRIIQTFIEKYDISGATVYTFCTSGGSGIEQSISDLKKLYPKVNISGGKRLNNATKADVNKWINSLH